MAVERNSTDAAFRTRYEHDRPEVAPIATKLMDWARERRLLQRPRTGETHDTLLCFLELGVNEHKIFALETNGLVWVLFSELQRRFPSKDASKKTAFLGTLREKLSEVAGGRAAPGSQGGKASWTLASTDVPALLRVLDWAIVELRGHYHELVASTKRHRV